MARLYSNENFPLPAVEELRKRGHDVLTIQETGKANQALTDEEVLEFVNKEKRILLTLNRRHFIKLHNKHYSHAGIFACTYDPNVRSFAARIDQALREDLANAWAYERSHRKEIDAQIKANEEA